MKTIVEYEDISLVIPKNGLQGIYYSNTHEHKIDIIEYLDGMIARTKRDKIELFVNFLGLSKCTMTIMNILYKLGYNPIDSNQKKEMRVGDIRYRITKDNCYYIQCKTGYKSYLTLQCVENVIALRNIPETIADTKRPLALYHYTRDSFLKGKARSENRILFSAAAISRTLFNRSNPDFGRASGGLRIKDKKYGSTYNQGPILEKYCRPGVRGALCFVTERGRKYRGPGIVLDVNSLYDYVACSSDMPSPRLIAAGNGIPKKRYLDRTLYYTIFKVEISATLKKGGIPCITPDGNETRYLESMEKRKITLTQSERDMLFDNYIISYYCIKSYIVFANGSKQFQKYIQPLYEQKRTLPKGIERDYVKSCLVGFIGTFARKVQKIDMYVRIDEDNGLLYGAREALTSEEYMKKLLKTDGLCFMNMAIVSAARRYMLTYIKKHMDRLLYVDTDSLHLSGYDIPKDIPISDRMGDFKVESTFTDCVYHGIKAYAHIEHDEVIPTIAGIPKDTHFDSIDEVFSGPFCIKTIKEDPETMGICYTNTVKNFNPDVKGAIVHKKERDIEWYDTHVIMPTIFEKNGHDKVELAVAMWNHQVDKGQKADFDTACDFIKKIVYKAG